MRYNTKQEALAAVQNLNKKILPGSSVPLQVFIFLAVCLSLCLFVSLSVFLYSAFPFGLLFVICNIAPKLALSATYPLS